MFREAIDAIKQEAPDIIVQVSTGTLNFGDDVFMNKFDTMSAFATAIKERGIVPEIECFDAGHFDNAMILVKKGLVSLPAHFDFVLGVPGAMSGTVRNLVFMANNVPAGSSWQAAGIARAELPLAVVSVVSGGHVRVGFEDNIYYSKGRLAKSNAELVSRVRRIAEETGREVATPDEARRILGIKMR